MTEDRLEADLAAMWRIRAFEEKLQALHKSGELIGSVHLCIGQEAAPVGACTELVDGDALFATYRGHGWALAKGTPTRELFAELLGRATGVNGGRGGSAYFSAPEYGFYGENSIVGAGASHAVGAALAGKHDGSGRIAMAVFGDGAMNQGAVGEAMNFAAAFDLPVLFVCENNRYSELTPINDMVRNDQLTERATALGIPATRIDGNDPARVRSTVAGYAAEARNGGGPAFVELITQRLVGHYIGDVQQYRTRAELEADGLVEPLAVATSALAGSGVDTDAIEGRARAEIEAAAEQALADPFADPDTAKEHLYA
ncbi:thiamine pyrophosphate-dependent dehydrogenase E1 component subunit alpha [Prauserella cavernicola]|uniref:Thiamine pyrophosphate-dependent dehydrogenase E1 component subunit alpha n=1 Tax=Prauserella cavernicola TaxID=2800127 RepID=A0A934V3P8_9PSEU|nr:thiamine pyrophosphate-dependent dehydrogenase E1 component subunit alpha [Prauserella cavernicola]MBK1783939.1 thiamine pyrophosphate-dependent dehydrogenase E1 component subunit alpha [Prauserella cavernicola]